jgi:uncharacterized protein (DUF924 family)
LGFSGKSHFSNLGVDNSFDLRKLECPLEAAILMDIYSNPVVEIESLNSTSTNVYKALMKTANPDAKEILKFWFPTGLENAMKLWFGKSPEVDMMIKSKYEELFQKASQGDLDHWLANPLDCLALLILLDQVPRNTYRHSMKMYAGDTKALAIVMKAFYYQHFKHLTPIQCIFLPCLVLTHSESVYCQQLCLDVWTNFVETRLKKDSHIMYFGKIFHHHWEVITKFGRFPHRNEILGRETSEEEKAFLLDTSYRFDLPMIVEIDEDKPVQIKFESNSDFLKKEEESKKMNEQEDFSC